MSNEITVILNDSVNEVFAEGVYGARLGKKQGRLWLDFYVDRVDPNSRNKRRVIVSRVVMDPNGIEQMIKALNQINQNIKSETSPTNQSLRH